MPAVTIGMVLAIVALVLGVLLMLAVLPLNPLLVGGLVVLLAIARLT